MRMRTLPPDYRADSAQTLRVSEALTIPDSGLSLTTLLLGASGSGKTTLAGLIALQGLLKAYGQVIIDPTGSLSDALIFRLLCFLRQFPLAEHEVLWQRLCYIDLGNPTVSFPIYYRRGSETLREQAERFIETLRVAHPNLVKQASVTWPELRRVGINAGMVLAALGHGGLTELESLLFRTREWEQSGRFNEAIRRNPEAAPAVAYFREQYLPLSRAQKSSLTSKLLDHVFTIPYDPKLRVLFGDSKPQLALEDVLETTGHTMLIDCRNVSDPEARRLATLWIIQYIVEHIKARGRRKRPLGFLIDEFADLVQQVPDGINPLSTLFDTLIQRYCRNTQVFLSLAFQSLNQIDESLRNTVLSTGNIIAGRIATKAEARILADVLFRTNSYRVKQYHNVWMSGANQYDRLLAPYVVERRPEFMNLTEQQDRFAERLTTLALFHFLCRPVRREGEVSQDVIPISIESAVQDAETGEYRIPDQELVDRVRSGLAARSRVQREELLKEQDARLPAGTAQAPPRQTREQAVAPSAPVPMPPAPRLMPNRAHPEPRHKVAIPPHPTLDEQQRALLAFLIEQPDMPVSGVYKGLGLSVRKGSEIRDSLTKQGFLLELELRSGKPGAGRPMTCMMPSFQAYSQLGITPPTGRGSIIHRRLQKLVAESAGAKGYWTHVEKPLDNGTIVDVHLEKGEEKIAVEIAIASRVELELAHFRNALAAGYTQVYGIFLDDQDLMARTEQGIAEAFSEEEKDRVRLLPVSKISQLGK